MVGFRVICKKAFTVIKGTNWSSVPRSCYQPIPFFDLYWTISLNFDSPRNKTVFDIRGPRLKIIKTSVNRNLTLVYTISPQRCSFLQRKYRANLFRFGVFFCNPFLSSVEFGLESYFITRTSLFVLCFFFLFFFSLFILLGNTFILCFGLLGVSFLIPRGKQKSRL